MKGLLNFGFFRLEFTSRSIYRKVHLKHREYIFGKSFTFREHTSFSM